MTYREIYRSLTVHSLHSFPRVTDQRSKIMAFAIAYLLLRYYHISLIKQ